MIRRLWLIVLFVAVSLGMILFIVFATNEPQRVVTLDDIYALLTTADGQNRLEEIADLLYDVDEEVDLIYTRAERKTAEETALAEGQAWTLEDMKYFLDSMDTRLAAIENRLEALEARAVDAERG
jgi:hypothetical protein